MKSGEAILATSPRDPRTGLRIVGFHAMAFAYRFVAGWAAQRGHD
jgi:hypothetical protein